MLSTSQLELRPLSWKRRPRLQLTMSGAEALVAVGLAGNVLQFIDFGTKLRARIREILLSRWRRSKEDRESGVAFISGSEDTRPEGAIFIS